MADWEYLVKQTHYSFTRRKKNSLDQIIKLHCYVHYKRDLEV